MEVSESFRLAENSSAGVDILRKVYFLIFLVFIFIGVRLSIPSASEKYFAEFLVYSFIFIAGSSQIGKIFRVKVFKNSISAIDFPLGLGLFVFFLNCYFKFTSSVILPLGLIWASAGFSIFLFIKRWRDQQWLSDLSALLDYSLLLSLCLILFWYLPGAGFLQFPLDFDSGMLHLALPKRWLFLDHVSPQVNYRFPFLGTFAHYLYFFCLKVFDGNDGFVKIVNFGVFLTLFSVCRNLKFKDVDLGKWPLIIPCLLVFYPDTREFLIATNLDAMFMMYLFSGFLVLLFSLESRKSEDLLLGTLLLGFSAGLKHFGFMMSAPLLVLYYSYFFLTGPLTMSLKWIRFCKISVLGGIVYLVTSLAFYIHNLVAGNNILFPFMGSKVNTYGWISKEIGDLANIIDVWGTRKDFLGFFFLVNDILEYPTKFQLLLLGTGYEFVYPGIFILSGLSLFFGLFLLSKKKPVFLLVALVNVLQLFFWYKGSQVVRYLLPNIAIGLMVFIYLSAAVFKQMNWLRLPKFYHRDIITGLLLIFSFSVLDKTRAKGVEVSYTEKQKVDVVAGRYGDLYQAMNYLRLRHAKGRILYDGDASFMQFIPDLDVCGDWFGPCRFEDFLALNSNLTHLKLRPIAETKEFLKGNSINWVVISWNYFYPHFKRPETLSLALPDLTCYSLEFHTSTVDVFKLNQECLSEAPQ